MSDGLPQELKDLMNQVLVIEAATGEVDVYNQPAYTSLVTVDCYLSRANKRALDRQGREVTSTLQAILADPTLVLTVDALLTISDGSHPAIIEILAAPDENGNEYYLEIRA